MKKFAELKKFKCLLEIIGMFPQHDELVQNLPCCFSLF